MGVYLSSPIRDKVSEDEERPHLRLGASSMQGWRTSQEDAHNCCPDFDPDTNTSLFACYDGHGGAEVAQYTAQHFPAFLKELDSYKQGNLSHALEEAFLGFDATLKEDSVIQTLKELAGVDGEDESEGNQEEPAALYEEATMPLEELLSRYGRGGAAAANALKKDKFQSPAIRPRKENGDQGAEGDSAGAGNNSNDKEKDTVRVKLENELMNGHSDNENNENIERASSQSRAVLQGTSSSSQANEAQAKEEKDSCVSGSGSSSSTRQGARDGPVDGSSCVDSTTSDDKETVKKIKVQDSSDSTKPESNSAASSSDVGGEGSREQGEAESTQDQTKPSDNSSNGVDSERPSSTTSLPSSSASSQPEEREEPGSSSSSRPTAAATRSSSAGSSSVQSSAPESSSSSSSAAGGSSSSGNSEDPGPCSSSKQEPEAGSSSGRTRSKRKNIIPEEGEDESSFDEDSSEDDDDEDDEEGAEPWASGSENSSDEDVMPGAEDGEDDEEEDEEEDDVMSGGEEPGSDSGCTAVVALLRGRELFVANAGDSRCVMCRGGKAFDMSIDHKPEDEIEHSRITKAGGRVTMDGRVNGGLNLSRAIGDHCYKRNAAMSDREQMITALPDVRSTVIEQRDEFMVLACDGIWNVMTSQDVVNFVAGRLKSGVTKLSSICEEMFDYCLSPDTSGDGTGCDNMTCMIIHFTQDGLKAASAKRPAEPELPESTDNTDLPEAKRARTESQAS